jgi:hypothetical protein
LKTGLLRGEEIERQPSLRGLAPIHHWQPKTQQAADQTVLGSLQSAPTCQISNDCQIRNGSIQSARKAQRIEHIRRDHPIAGVVLSLVQGWLSDRRTSATSGK